MRTKNIVKNTGIAAGIFVLAIASSMLLFRLNVQKQSSVIFIFAVFLISLFTDAYIYGVFSAVLGMLAVNFAFTYPYFQWDFCEFFCNF